ncbi:MAG: integrase core domain-containing protein [Planctomycetaceae bacterium]
MRGVPKCVRSDNGPEFVAKAIRGCLSKLRIDALYIAPGSPWKNGDAESFHSKLKYEFVLREEFENLAAARPLTAAWCADYNDQRPHNSLRYRTPAEYASDCDLPQPVLS